MYGRAGLDAVFGLLLASGVGAGLVFLRVLRNRDLRFAAALTTGHLVGWTIMIGLLMALSPGPDALIEVALIEPGFYAGAALLLLLALRWFRTTRRLLPGQP